MLLPSEWTDIEIVGAYRVSNPVRVLALAEEMRRAAKRRRENMLLGLTVWEAIELALRRGRRQQVRGGIRPAAVVSAACRVRPK